MNSRDRVLKSLAHIQPDRIAVDFGSTAVTGMHVTVVAALRDYYGLEKKPVKVHEPYQMLGMIDEDLKRTLGIDVEGVPAPNTIFGFPNENWRPWRTDSGLEVLVSGHFKIIEDGTGDTLVYPKGDTTAPPSGRMPKNGHFFDTIVRQNPIDEDKLDPRDNLEEFGPVTDADLQYFADNTRRVAGTGRSVMATFGGTAFGDIALVPAPFLTHPKGIRDVEEWYVSTVTRRDYIHKVFDKQCEYALANLARIKTVVGSNVDTVFICGTDFGTQSSTFCSQETFRELYFPYYKQVNDWIHRNTSWKTFKHSCGSVVSLIPAMIESGFDILNPVQCSAAGMEAEGLKEKFGDQIVFWGGGVDTQKTLPFGTPLEVREQVLRRCEVLNRQGGFVFNTVHNIQANTPVENIVAMFEAVKEFNGR